MLSFFIILFLNFEKLFQSADIGILAKLDSFFLIGKKSCILFVNFVHKLQGTETSYKIVPILMLEKFIILFFVSWPTSRRHLHTGYNMWFIGELPWIEVILVCEGPKNVCEVLRLLWHLALELLPRNFTYFEVVYLRCRKCTFELWIPMQFGVMTHIFLTYYFLWSYKNVKKLLL